MAPKPAEPENTPNDAEPPPDVGPLRTLDEDDTDSLEESDEPEPAAEHLALLRTFDDGGDLDDSTAADLDDGIQIDDDAESEQTEFQDPPVDVGDLLSEAAEPPAGAGSDDFGPTDAELVIDVAEDEVIDLKDDAEGTEQADEVLDEDLPKFDERPDDDVEGAVAEDTDTLPEADEEELPGRTELPWLEVPLAASRRRDREVTAPRCVVRGAGLRVVAAGVDVVRIDGSDVVEELGSVPAAAESLVVDADHRTVVLSTRGGELYRIPASGSAPELLVSWQTAALAEQGPGITLGGPTPSSRPALLLRSNGGTLLESTDRGTTWRAVDLGGKILALSTGTPPLCVVQSKSAVRLFRSEPSGGFSPVGQPVSFEVDRLSLSAEGDIVAVLEPGRGVHVSADGGVQFRRVSGTARATAVAVGRLGSRPSAFAALFDPASGRAHVAWIDAVSADAYVIGVIDPTTDDEEDEWARVASLAWDAHTETLWAAGAFGLRRFRRPASA